jgi:hypothetical protein
MWSHNVCNLCPSSSAQIQALPYAGHVNRRFAAEDIRTMTLLEGGYDWLAICIAKSVSTPADHGQPDARPAASPFPAGTMASTQLGSQLCCQLATTWVGVVT